jgi:hypothetical protein
MELSSFQLELFDRSPDIAAVLNITPNHLDRHPSMSHYGGQANILQYQSSGDACILNADDAYRRLVAQWTCQIEEGVGQPVYFRLYAAGSASAYLILSPQRVPVGRRAGLERQPGLPTPSFAGPATFNSGAQCSPTPLTAACIAGTASGGQPPCGRGNDLRRRGAPPEVVRPAQRRALGQ